MPTIAEYVQNDGANPFRKWFDSLDAQAAAKIAVAVARLEMGNTSGVKWMGAIGEYRIDWGPGYRIYIMRDGNALIVLLGGRHEERPAERHRPSSDACSRIQSAESCCATKTPEVNNMALTREFKQTVADRAKRDPAFAKALLDEATTLFLNGEPHTARLILRDLVNATIGFEALAVKTAKPAKSLHRMLSRRGNPSMDNLATILNVVRKKLRVALQVRTVDAA
jgi:putative addiction module killer protein